MAAVKEPIIDRLRSVLMHSINDMRSCPKCDCISLPEDEAAVEAWRLFKDLFGQNPDGDSA